MTLARDGARLVRGIESARQRLADALRIRRGSYPILRDYGCTIDTALDRALSPAGEAAIFAAVAETISHGPNGLADLTLRSVRLVHAEHVATVDIVAEWTAEDRAITAISVRQELAG